MSNISLHQARKLYQIYSPLKTSLSLFDYFQKIIYDPTQKVDNIRERYIDEISDKYINEAVIKSAFVEKFSFNKSPNSTVTIFELKVNNSRADICMINGKSKVFEIKTEYDTFNRLDQQISDYKLIFDYIYIVIPKHKLATLLQIISKDIGVYTYRKNKLGNISFSLYQEPTINGEIDPVTQLRQFTKKEIKVITNTFEVLSEDEFIDKSIDIFSKDQINRFYKDNLKLKYACKWKYLLNNRNSIKTLDYQWFFKNNIPIKKVYK